MSISSAIADIRKDLPPQVELICISKTHPAEMIQEAYDCGERHFGENKVQELAQKYETLPKDIKWHFIGHLQTNKVKYIAPFVHLIHSVDSVHLLSEIDRQAKKNNRTIDCLIQLHIAQEESKSGVIPDEIDAFVDEILQQKFQNIVIRGMMTMATNTENEDQIHKEFHRAKTIFNHVQNLINTENFDILSMGMSGDYGIAIAEGATMIRIGSTIFGQRWYNVS